MDFYDRFELLTLVREGSVKTFEAREIATGRQLRVHLLLAPKSPIQAALLKAISQLPEPESRRIVDRGKNEGTHYLVTERLTEYASLEDWVMKVTRGDEQPRSPFPYDASVQDTVTSLRPVLTTPAPLKQRAAHASLQSTSSTTQPTNPSAPQTKTEAWKHR